MKLRIQRNSLRLRLSRTELSRLEREGLLEETIYFGPSSESQLTYALAWDRSVTRLEVQYSPQRVTVWLPRETAARWFHTSKVGIDGEVDLGARGTLSVLVEKDFACLDRSPEENADTFPNPLAAIACRP